MVKIYLRSSLKTSMVSRIPDFEEDSLAEQVVEVAEQVELVINIDDDQLLSPEVRQAEATAAV